MRLSRSASAGCGVAIALVFMLAPGTMTSAGGEARLQAEKSPHAASESAGTSLRAIVASGRLEMLRWPNFPDYRVQVDNVYRRSGYATIWIHKGQPTSQALEMISILRQADDKGLLAEDYDSSYWPDRLAHLQAQHTPLDEARFDVALTVCTMRYVSDLRIGRINPRQFQFNLGAGRKRLDVAALVQKHLVKAANLPSALANLEPQSVQYAKLQEALVKYMQLAKQDDGITLPDPHGIVFYGTNYEGVPQLAKLLHLLGDLPESVVIPEDSRLYDWSLVDAVKHFQQRHGLRPDGYLNVNTLNELNVPLSERVQQIRLTLERYRWLNYDFTQPHIIVNIPGFRLYARDKNGAIALTMTVDVGAEYDRTPVLEDKIEYLVFRPYWDVPLNIVRDEIISNIQEDADYMEEMHFEAVDADGKVVADKRASQAILQQMRSGKLRVRQKPGPDNAMGLVKFIFPNRYNVYLHDIPTWGSYFAVPDRNISHGCIHVEEPAKLAAWVLRDKPKWTLEKIQQAMQSGQNNRRVNLTKPLPVLILYMTAVVGEDGDVYFYRDIYGYDAQLENALAKGYPYPQ